MTLPHVGGARGTWQQQLSQLSCTYSCRYLGSWVESVGVSMGTFSAVGTLPFWCELS